MRKLAGWMFCRGDGLGLGAAKRTGRPRRRWDDRRVKASGVDWMAEIHILQRHVSEKPPSERTPARSQPHGASHRADTVPAARAA